MTQEVHRRMALYGIGQNQDHTPEASRTNGFSNCSCRLRGIRLLTPAWEKVVL